MKENKNKGFTLIEILVAVVALSLVVIPLLQGFVTSAKVNKKAREQMEATNVAQSVMEEYANSTAEEIWEEFNPGGIYEESTQFTDQKFDYVKSGYAHNNKNYDVKVYVDAQEYYGGTPTSYNENEYAQITSIDTSKDAIYAESERVLKDALDYYVGKNMSATTINSSYTKEQFQTKLERTIRVDIEKIPDGTDDYTDVNITYAYEAMSGWVDPGDEIYSKSLNLYTNQNIPAATRPDIRNVYILYRPYYEGLTDTIEIVNHSNLDVNVYIIKMDICDDAYLDMNELGYNATVHVHEDEPINYGGGTFVAHTKLFTNLGYNMAKVDNESTPYDDRLCPSQVTYIYYPIKNSTTNLTGTLLGNKLERDYFVPEYAQQRMYKMKVEVYPAGSAGDATKKLAELSN